MPIVLTRWINISVACTALGWPHPSSTQAGVACRRVTRIKKKPPANQDFNRVNNGDQKMTVILSLKHFRGLDQHPQILHFARRKVFLMFLSSFRKIKENLMTKPLQTLRIPTVISSFGTIKGTKSHHLRQHLILTNRVRPRRHPTWHEVVTWSLLFDFEASFFSGAIHSLICV